MKPSKLFSVCALFVGIFTVFVLGGCSEFNPPYGYHKGTYLWSNWVKDGSEEAAESPGFYYVTGWNGSDSDLDIDGKVGYPLNVYGPTAKVRPRSTGWQATYQVTSGTLPDGMTMADNGLISGIPTERGNYIATVECYNVTSGGLSYPNQHTKQQLRFHITGSGEVHE